MVRQIWALNVTLKLSTKKKASPEKFQWSELSSKYDFKMPFNCGEQDRLRYSWKKEMEDLGTTVIIQDCGSEIYLYFMEIEMKTMEEQRNGSSLVVRLDIVGRKKAKNSTNHNNVLIRKVWWLFWNYEENWSRHQRYNITAKVFHEPMAWKK